MTKTPEVPNSPAELLLQQLQLEGQQEKQETLRGLNPDDLAEVLTSEEFGLKPTEMLELIQHLAQRLLNFHANVSAKLMDDNNDQFPGDSLFWLRDLTKLDIIVTLMREINN